MSMLDNLDWGSKKELSHFRIESTRIEMHFIAGTKNLDYTKWLKDQLYKALFLKVKVKELLLLFLETGMAPTKPSEANKI